jgi:hypothetical protein
MDTNAWAVLAQLLRVAADEFSNHGCNDMSLPNTFDNRELIESAEKWNSPEQYAESGIMYSKDGKEIYTSDAFLMSYFCHLAEELSDSGTR